MQPARFLLDIAGVGRQLACGVPAIATHALGATPGAGGFPRGLGRAKMRTSPRPGPSTTAEMSVKYCGYTVTMDD